MALLKTFSQWSVIIKEMSNTFMKAWKCSWGPYSIRPLSDYSHSSPELHRLGGGDGQCRSTLLLAKTRSSVTMSEQQSRIHMNPRVSPWHNDVTSCFALEVTLCEAGMPIPTLQFLLAGWWLLLLGTLPSYFTHYRYVFFPPLNFLPLPVSDFSQASTAPEDVPASS